MDWKIATGIVGFFVAVFWWILVHCHRLFPLLKAQSHTRLYFSPTCLTRSEIGFVLSLFVFRSLGSVLEWLHLSRRSGNEATDHLYLSMPLKVNRADLDQYRKAVTGTHYNNINWDNMQLSVMLSALSEPAMLLLLATRKNKIKPLGSVNVRNHFELFRPELCTPEQLVSHKEITLLASASNEFRPVKRGFEIDLTVSINVSDGSQRSPITAFQQTFTMLQFAKTNSQVTTDINSDQTKLSTSPSLKGNFSFANQEPSAWAKVCKDYNPIHTSVVAARMFGFPGKLAHGNHILARACTTDVASNYFASLTSSQPLWVKVSFKRPVMVPSQLELRIDTNDDLHSTTEASAAFEINSKGKLRVIGCMGMLNRTHATAVVT
ncbi:hypothetical protein B0A52_01550 [Exophiala mesophila]|uniref:MaoC-like domain-containing protein n=1 Tax=Exophiala mesophila TaxID=212818 RepID=A0A438NFC0_EXOME|nr:hypothetical protein B0A52_01550 [Exophiala mesophila]